MHKFNITPIDTSLAKKIQHKIDFKTKPLGSLGVLEELAKQIALIQNTPSPVLANPHILIFAGDHGIAKEKVSAYPQEVTFQMIINFLAGGAAINVLSKQHNIELKIIDAGVNYEFPPHYKLIDMKIAKGTKSFLKKPAMTMFQVNEAMQKGAITVLKTEKEGCNIIGFGEMGIGNTSSASMLMSYICNIPIEECVGRGTGVDDEQLAHKINILQESQKKHHNFVDTTNPLSILQYFGGFEIAMMVGAMLKAASLRMTIMVDGFITTSAFLIAHSLAPNIKKYAIFCHQSNEQGHLKMLNHLKVTGIIDLGMRLGEGSGVAAAYPIIQSAVLFLNQMASFDDAGVSTKGEN